MVGYGEDGSCKIQFNGTNMPGLTKTSAIFTDATTTQINTDLIYTVPSIPDSCAGKTLTNITAALYDGSILPANVKSNYYSTKHPGITLDQCSGTYSWTPYPSSLKNLFTATNTLSPISTKYWKTCASSTTVKPVIILNQWRTRPDVLTCNDTDPTQDPMVFGYVRTYNNSILTGTYPDACDPAVPNCLLQRFCSGNVVSGGVCTDCPYGCCNGVCKTSSTEKCSTTIIS